MFVISLPSAGARRERFLTRASLGNVPVEVVNAHTKPSSELFYDPKSALTAKGRTLHSAELGVYSSHFYIWRKIIREDIEQAFIFEDDVVVDWTLLPEIASLRTHFTKLHYIRLFAKRPCRMKILTEQLRGGRCIVDYRGYAYGAQAYFITRYAAELLTGHCRTIRMAIDDEMDRSWEHGLPNLAIFPFPAFEENVPSTIGPDRFTVQTQASPWSPSRVQFRVADRSLRLKQQITGYGLVERLNALK